MKRLVNSHSGAVKENTDLSPDLTLAQTSIDELTAKAIEILRREIVNLMGETSRGKLSPTSSTALVGYIKLLGDLKEKEQDLVEELSTEFLEKISKDD